MTKEIVLSPFQLFGEAVSINLPKELYSLDQMRQIPDNQEVFAYENDSLIVELLECAEGNAATEAISFHFDVIKEDNTADTAQVHLVEEIDVPVLLNGGFAAILIGNQLINQNEVTMGIILIRLSNVETDIVVTWHSNTVTKELLLQIAESLTIHNWSLFN